ncbi:cation:proton antiporter [Natronospora cellulosivora (SeqCode)]
MNNFFNQMDEVKEWLLYHHTGDKIIYVLAFFIIMAMLGVFITKRYRIPFVIAYVFLGIFLSVDLLRRIPFLSTEFKEWYAFTVENLGFISHLALGFIAFTIGSELSIRTLKQLGKSMVYITILQAVVSFVLVALGVIALGYPLYMGLILGAIATATNPAATVMVFQEYGAEGLLSSMIMAVVAIGDAVALLIFSLARPIALMQAADAGTFQISEIFLIPAIEIFGSLALGILIGYLSQKVMLRVDDKVKKVLLIVSTIVGGVALSLFLHLSPLITNMAVGFAYRNFARRNPGIADYLDTMTIPLYAMFFILAGTEINFSRIASLSFMVLAIVFFISRLAGKYAGAYLGASLAKAPDKVKKYVGLGLFSHSGVAIALAFIVQRELVVAPDAGLLIFNILLLTAAFTEVVGPLTTKYAIIKAGESNRQY